MTSDRKHDWPRTAPVHLARHEGYTQSCPRCPAKRRWSKSAGRWIYNSAASPNDCFMKFAPRCEAAYWSSAASPAESDADAGLHGEETLLYVFYTHANKKGDPDRNLMRGRTGADLGLAKDPKFTDAEIQQILYAAKMAALKCVFARKTRG